MTIKAYVAGDSKKLPVPSSLVEQFLFKHTPTRYAVSSRVAKALAEPL